MSEMIERVAAALCIADGQDPEGLRVLSDMNVSGGYERSDWATYLEKARAVVEAMREPTRAMVKAGGFWARNDWRAMIDAALKSAAAGQTE